MLMTYSILTTPRLRRVLGLLLGLAMLVAIPAAAKTKIAFVGLKHSHCWRQLENVQTIKAVELVGVAEPEAELIEYAKTINPTAHYETDYKKMIEANKPDIIWAFVENNRHLEILEFAAPKGIHLIFEKPLASNHAEAIRMKELAAKYDIKVMTNYQMAWWPTNQEIKRQADAAAIGDVWRLHGIVGHGGPGSQGPRSKYFFEWLTDPVKNGAGALVDFGCYNALWSLWFRGRPETVYAQVNYLQRERFPKVEDNSVMVLTYPDGVSILEGSWDLPHSFQDLEVFGREGSLYMNRNKVEIRKGRRGEPMPVKTTPMSEERLDPIKYMVDRVKSGKAVDNIMALDINVSVVEILDAAKESIKPGKAISLN